MVLLSSMFVDCNTTGRFLFSWASGCQQRRAPCPIARGSRRHVNGAARWHYALARSKGRQYQIYRLALPSRLCERSEAIQWRCTPGLRPIGLGSAGTGPRRFARADGVGANHGRLRRKQGRRQGALAATPCAGETGSRVHAMTSTASAGRVPIALVRLDRRLIGQHLPVPAIELAAGEPGRILLDQRDRPAWWTADGGYSAGRARAGSVRMGCSRRSIISLGTICQNLPFSSSQSFNSCAA